MPANQLKFMALPQRGRGRARSLRMSLVRGITAGIAAMSLALSAYAGTVSEQGFAQKLKFYEGISTLEAGFTQVKTLKEMDMKLNAEGKLKLNRPDRVVWEIVRPSPLKVSLDREKIEIVSGSGKEATTQIFRVADAPSDKAAKSMAALVAWLNLDAHKLYQEYQITSQGADLFQFEPKDKSISPFHQLEMKLDPKGNVSRLMIHETSGDLLEINFSKPKITRTGGKKK